jgi:predicted transcriptional regulator of viral defense system
MLFSKISEFESQGKMCFSFQSLQRQTDLSARALYSALYRLKKKGVVANPTRGFYVIIPPRYRSLGCLPAEQFIPEMMAYLGSAYYAGLLSAAAYYGAAHQRPQVFQVVVAKPRRELNCGNVWVEFIVRNNVREIPVQTRNTPAGLLNVSTPEATALDLVGYFKRCGGLDNVATLLAELSPRLDGVILVKVASKSPISWTQRLGYLLDLVGANELSDSLAELVAQREPVKSSLLPSVQAKGAEKSKRWKLLINTGVEPEI